MSQAQRLIVGISGASGAVLAVRLLEAMRPLPVETHLVVTPTAIQTLRLETGLSVEQVASLADVSYNPNDMSAAIASGSFPTLGMVVIPCSIKTLSAVANSYSEGLLARAADATLKEGRPLVLVVREVPLHRGHLRLLTQAAEAGAVIFPPVPQFYTHPATMEEMIDGIVGRVLARIGIENSLYRRWGESGTEANPEIAP